MFLTCQDQDQATACQSSGQSYQIWKDKNNKLTYNCTLNIWDIGMGWCETCRNPRTSAPPDPPQWRTWLERRTPPCPPPPLSPAIVLISRQVHHYQRERTNRRVATSLNVSFTLSDFIAAMHASTFTMLLENILRFGACNAFGCSAVLVQSYIGCTYGVAMSQSISSDIGLSENWKQLVQSWNIKKSSTQCLNCH